jgi:glycosyltransferase involved in cell wall biosynthesis
MARASAKISIVLLSFNSSRSIERTLRSLASLSDDVHVIDSFSTDDTVEVCRSYHCHVIQRPFLHYADQRNWAIDNLNLKYEWQMHVDADEEFTPELIATIMDIDLEHCDADGFIIGRKIVFLGRVLKYGAINKTWHYRLFRTGYGRCEDRLYDQHFVAKGRTRRLNAFMLDHQDNTLSEWTSRHNRWSDMEVREVLSRDPGTLIGQVSPNARGNIIERKRNIKKHYYGLPIFWRSTAYFLYGYFVRLGFMDGARGFIWCALQGFWFRLLVDAKIYEAGRRD